ncbi:hypothetical protein JCGZ_09121 [Jatropha curcas]|uniref:C2H2-type domain-containing protein n=1 Tax=Jatropha curcas TaxID=180498 RepID=A0A067KL22_JATCU|nr:zinc finger protein 10 [Jatropha curcas]KDP35683.1 hypothetical protein JCGZ_09121 [Jatropha curcas]
MEQARCWMLTKRKHSMTSNHHLQKSTNSHPPYEDSWEEQAFAEDAAASLGGCVWPPRSYSCSFCRREFRSAQALGGHMNVHRRDRARLKQSPGPNNELVNHHHDHQNHHNLFQNQFSSLGNYQYPSQICTLVYSPNPNSNPSAINNIASPPSPTRQLNCNNEKNFFPPFSSSCNIKQVDGRKSIPPRSSPPISVTDGYYCKSDPRSKAEKNSRIVGSTECSAKVDCVKTDLSVSLNLVVRRTCPTITDNNDDDVEGKEAIVRKRRKHNHVQSEVFEISPCFREELDLELRLGDRPSKVK